MQALLDERDDLVARALGLDEVRVVGVELEQPVGVLAQREEVVDLRECLDRTLVDGAELDAALAVEQLGGELELLAADAVRAFVGAFVDVTGVVDRLPELLDPLGVTGLGGADEVVVAGVDGRQHRLPLGLDEPVGPLLRRDPVRLGGLEDLLPVLVGARSGTPRGSPIWRCQRASTSAATVVYALPMDGGAVT